MPFLFSYGTLKQEEVQLSTFGRRLVGEEDILVGFEQSIIRIEDPAFVAKSGNAHHRILRFSGNAASRVGGIVFEITEDELACADSYEPDEYHRISVKLASGKRAWVYVDGRCLPERRA